MTYKALLLTKKESKDPMCCGYKFAYNNKSRWVDLGISDPETEIATYDVSKTSIVKNNMVYTIYKDFIILDENIRLYILQHRDLENDRIETESNETVENTN